jgi:hypothetical protein
MTSLTEGLKIQYMLHLVLQVPEDQESLKDPHR